MLPKSEAQRVIAISLGKIANYRSQRGGTSLHKNLLVANVLQKVRTYVAEDEQSVQWERQFERCTLNEVCEPMAVDDSKVSCDEISENISAKPNEELPSVLPKTQATSECSNLIGSRVSCDTVNGSAISDVSMADYYSSTGPISTSAGEEERSPGSVGLLSSTTHSTNGAKSSREMRLRARCLKRRQAIEDRDIVLVKRRRYDMETTDVNHTSPNLTSWRVSCVSSDCDSDVESDGLDVDQESSALSQGENTMDVEQICNLVSVFKCSFQGLGLIENPTVNNSETSTSSPTDYAFSNSQNLVQDLGNKKENKPPLRRGLSLPDLCAKQADMCQKFQLTAPVLALTV